MEANQLANTFYIAETHFPLRTIAAGGSPRSSNLAQIISAPYPPGSKTGRHVNNHSFEALNQGYMQPSKTVSLKGKCELLPKAERLHLTLFVPRCPLALSTVTKVALLNLLQFFRTPRALSLNEEIRITCGPLCKNLFGRHSYVLYVKLSSVCGQHNGLFNATDKFIACSSFTELYVKSVQRMECLQTLICKSNCNSVTLDGKAEASARLSAINFAIKNRYSNILRSVICHAFHKISCHELYLLRPESTSKGLEVQHSLMSALCNRSRSGVCTLVHDINILPRCYDLADRLLSNCRTSSSQMTSNDISSNLSICESERLSIFKVQLSERLLKGLKMRAAHQSLIFDTVTSVTALKSNCISDKLRLFFERSSNIGIADNTIARVSSTTRIARSAFVVAGRRIRENIFGLLIDFRTSTNINFRGDELKTHFSQGNRVKFAHSWSDVGGHDSVKGILQGAFRTARKHRSLFSKSHFSKKNILLFGPPGTGKTLLAKVIAVEGKVKFINVKGPEMLNMYVGESERLIRDIFREALENSPSLIFFDEVESLTPRKNGVENLITTRIVSQLAIEIDFSRTFPDLQVMGASNRPDLIDVSLLRPGRFDCLLYVGIDTTITRRVKLLRALTQHMNELSDFDLECVARYCNPRNSGADVYSICVKAWILAVKRHVSEIDTEFHKFDQGSTKIFVTKQELIACAVSVQPSLSEHELYHYEVLKRLYDPNST